ncbi:MOSC domain-containing protein [Campylobacterota bacterium]
MSLNNVGQVLELFISVKDENGNTVTISQDTLDLDTGGVLKDKFHAKDPGRSILLSSIESYTLAQQNNIDMPYGALGENILMDFNPYKLQVGDRLTVGDVIVEITQECTLCKGLSKVSPKAPKLLKEHRGIFAKTVTPGTIKKGDTVYI